MHTMDIPDILRLTNDLLILRQDRLIMAFEDDRSNLCRSLQSAQSKIERLTKCLKNASDDYDNLLKRVANSANLNGNSKKRPIDESVGVSVVGQKSVRISDKLCASPVKAASPSKAQNLVNPVSSIKKQRTESADASIKNNLFSSPDSHFAESSSPESMDCLNIGQALPTKKSSVNTKVESPVKNDKISKTDTKSTTTTATLVVNSNDVSSVFPVPLTVVPKSMKETPPSSSISSNSTASNQLQFKSKNKIDISTNNSNNNNSNTTTTNSNNNNTSTNSNINRTNAVYRANTIDTSTIPKSTGNLEAKYPALDLVESKPKRDNKSIKISRSSSLVTTSTTTSSKISITNDRDNDKSTKTSASVVSHNRTSSNYKCVDVVRKKSERDALPGHTCFECEAFYQAMIQQGIMSEDGKKEHLRQCSRHKAKYTPPTTPEGFWDLTIHTPEEWK